MHYKAVQVLHCIIAVAVAGTTVPAASASTLRTVTVKEPRECPGPGGAAAIGRYYTVPYCTALRTVPVTATATDVAVGKSQRLYSNVMSVVISHNTGTYLALSQFQFWGSVTGARKLLQYKGR
jgi:hypothetical protein